MQAVHWRLLAELSDGLPKHIAALAEKAGVKPQQLNGLWLKMPAHIQELLRQQDDFPAANFLHGRNTRKSRYIQYSQFTPFSGRVSA